MTDNIWLADIFHDSNAGVLVSPALESRLAEAVFSGMTDRTALCVEGLSSMHGDLKPGTPGHDEASSRLWPGIRSLTAGHPLRGADCRPRLDYSLHQRVAEETDILLDFFDRHVRLTETPSTPIEAVEWIRDGKDAFVFAQRPDARVRACADRVLRREKVWLKSYGDLAERCARTHDRVYVIAGLTHAIGLHLKYGWPLMWLTEILPELTPDFVYRGGMNFSRFADAARRA